MSYLSSGAKKYLVPLAVIVVTAVFVYIFVFLPSVALQTTAAQVQKFLPDISKTPVGLEKKRNSFLAMLDPKDSNSILRMADAIQKSGGFSFDCHDVAHDLGHRAFDLYGFQTAMTYDNTQAKNHASVMDICAGGYVHGILESASLSDDNFVEDPGALCREVPKSNSAACFHGVGHALMFLNARDVETSLTQCRSFDKPDSYRCFEGVWMETFWGDARHASKHLGWDPKDPLKVCVDEVRDAKPTCYLYSSFGYLRDHKGDYSGAVHFCYDPRLSADDRKFCMKGVGITMISHLDGQDLQRTEKYVTGLNSTEKIGFYEGVMGYARFSGVPESKILAACAAMHEDVALCENAVESSK